MRYKNKNLFSRLIRGFILLTFLTGQILTPSMVSAQVLPAPGTMLGLSAAYAPPVLLGLKVHPDNPLLFDFIVDRGQSNLSDQEFKIETEKLVKYFLAALTIPDKEVWVNLSPYEKDRIIPDVLSRTQMGKTMLEQDYMLKQLAASLTNPETKLGKMYWDQVHQAQTLDVGRSTLAQSIGDLNKVWIVPAQAKVLESNGIVVVDQKRLKVMMAQDVEENIVIASPQGDAAISESRIASLDRPTGPHVGRKTPVFGTPLGLDSLRFAGNDKVNLSTHIFRSTILPSIEKQVNEGKDFAAVRQVYNSVILAAWYKQALKESLLGRVYADQAKVAGVEIDDKDMKERVYAQYVEAFKKGAYNFIKEEEDVSGDLIPRKYFSGGIEVAKFGQVAGSALEIQVVSSAAVEQPIRRASAAIVTVQGEELRASTVIRKAVGALAAAAVLAGVPHADAGALAQLATGPATISQNKTVQVPLTIEVVGNFVRDVESYWENSYMGPEGAFEYAHQVVRPQITQTIQGNPAILAPENFSQTGFNLRQMYDALAVAVVDTHGNPTGVVEAIERQYPNTVYSAMVRDAMQTRWVAGYRKELNTPQAVAEYFELNSAVEVALDYQNLLAQPNVSAQAKDVIQERLAYMVGALFERRSQLNPDNGTLDTSSPAARAVFDANLNVLANQVVSATQGTWLPAFITLEQMKSSPIGDTDVAMEKLNSQLAQYQGLVDKNYSVHLSADHAYGSWRATDERIIVNAAQVLSEIHKQSPLKPEQIETMVSRLWETAKNLDDLLKVQSPDRQSIIVERLAWEIQTSELFSVEKIRELSDDKNHPLNLLATAILRTSPGENTTPGEGENIKTGFAAWVELYLKKTPAGSKTQLDMLNWIKTDSQQIVNAINTSPASFSKITAGWAAADFYMLLVENAGTARPATQKTIIDNLLSSMELSGYEFLKNTVRWHRTSEFMMRLAQSGELGQFLAKFDPQNQYPRAQLELAYQIVNDVDIYGNRVGVKVISQLEKALQQTPQGVALLSDLKQQAQAVKENNVVGVASSALSDYLLPVEDGPMRDAVKILARKLFALPEVIGVREIQDFRMLWASTNINLTIDARLRSFNNSRQSMATRAIAETLIIMQSEYPAVFSTAEQIADILEAFWAYSLNFKLLEEVMRQEDSIRSARPLAVRQITSLLVLNEDSLPLNKSYLPFVFDYADRLKQYQNLLEPPSRINEYLDGERDFFPAMTSAIENIRLGLSAEFLDSRDLDGFAEIMHDVSILLKSLMVQQAKDMMSRSGDKPSASSGIDVGQSASSAIKITPAHVSLGTGVYIIPMIMARSHVVLARLFEKYGRDFDEMRLAFDSNNEESDLTKIILPTAAAHKIRFTSESEIKQEAELMADIIIRISQQALVPSSNPVDQAVIDLIAENRQEFVRLRSESYLSQKITMHPFQMSIAGVPAGKDQVSKLVHHIIAHEHFHALFNEAEVYRYYNLMETIKTFFAKTGDEDFNQFYSTFRRQYPHEDHFDSAILVAEEFWVQFYFNSKYEKDAFSRMESLRQKVRQLIDELGDEDFSEIIRTLDINEIKAKEAAGKDVDLMEKSSIIQDSGVVFLSEGSNPLDKLVSSSTVTSAQINDATARIMATLQQTMGFWTGILQSSVGAEESLTKLIKVLLTKVLPNSNISNPTIVQINQWVKEVGISGDLKNGFSTAESFLSTQEIMVQYLGYRFENGAVAVVPQVILQEISGLAKVASAPISAVGGINFDPTLLNLQIKRDGQGVPLPLPQQNLQQINIQGLYPIIINIQPVNAQTLPLFLGQAPKQSGDSPMLTLKHSG